MMDKVCSNDKQPSGQRFVPGKDAPIDGNGTKHRSASKTGATTNHQHQHRGAINVYHHHMNSSGSKNTNMNGSKNTNMNGSKNTNDSKNTNGSKNTNDSKNMNMNGSKSTNDTKKNQGYMEPEAGAGVLGFL